MLVQIVKKYFHFLGKCRTVWIDGFKRKAAVSCSPDAYRLGGVGLGSGMMGKLGRAWDVAWACAWACACHGAWRGAWVVVVVVM